MSNSFEPVTVLVTGAGGPAGVAVIRRLRSDGHRVVAVDCDPSAVGLRLADDSLVGPRSKDPGFVETLIDAANNRGVDAIISTVAEELGVLSDAQDSFTAAGIAHWFPRRSAVDTCVDKWLFAQTLSGTTVPVPATGLSFDGVPGPWIVKPRFGRGSRDVFSVEDPKDFPWVLARVPEPIVQTRLPGREFTADGLVAPTGELWGCVPRWRTETKAGISTKGETFLHAGINALVEETARAVGLTGPICLQGFLDDDQLGLVEVNPRFSGGLPLSLASGCDLVGQYLGVMLGQPVDLGRLTSRSGVIMLRYFEEVIEG